MEDLRAKEKKDYKTICRTAKNRSNPYVQLSKEALWDANLSLRAVGLWSRCMSRPDNWTFCMKELIKNSKEGRKAVYTAINELIQHGYVMRLDLQIREKGKVVNNICEYIFFEFSATEEEKKHQEEEFKKRFQRSHFGDTGNGDTRNGDSRKEHLLIYNNTDKEEDTEIEEKNTHPSLSEETEKEVAIAPVCDFSSSSKKPKISKPPSEIDPNVKVVAEKLAEIVKKENPTCRPEMATYYQQVGMLLNDRQQKEEHILQAMRWAAADKVESPSGDWKGWSPVVTPGKKGIISFVKNFEKIYQASRSQKARKFAPATTTESMAALLARSDEKQRRLFGDEDDE